MQSRRARTRDRAGAVPMPAGWAVVIVVLVRPEPTPSEPCPEPRQGNWARSLASRPLPVAGSCGRCWWSWPPCRWPSGDGGFTGPTPSGPSASGGEGGRLGDGRAGPGADGVVSDAGPRRDAAPDPGGEGARGDRGAAARLLGQVQGTPAEMVAARLEQGQLLFQLDRFREAEDAYRQLLRYQATSLPARRALVGILGLERRGSDQEDELWALHDHAQGKPAARVEALCLLGAGRPRHPGRHAPPRRGRGHGPGSRDPGRPGERARPRRPGLLPAEPRQARPCQAAP